MFIITHGYRLVILLGLEVCSILPPKESFDTEVCVAGPNKTLMILVHEDCGQIYDLKQRGEMLKTLTNTDSRRNLFGRHNLLTGN